MLSSNIHGPLSIGVSGELEHYEVTVITILVSASTKRKEDKPTPVSYTHLTLPTT